MTRNKLAIIAAATSMALGAAGAASAQNVTSMGYVDSLEWQINHAAQTGRISEPERDRLMGLERRTQAIAWRCNAGHEAWACDRVVQNVNYINASINRSAYYGYGYGNRYVYHRNMWDGFNF